MNNYHRTRQANRQAGVDRNAMSAKEISRVEYQNLSLIFLENLSLLC
jgi:hypothetical protein